MKSASPLGEVLVVALAFLAGVMFVVHCIGCAATQVRAEEAEAGYLAQQLRCVDQYADRPSIDRCREDVRARWLAAHNLSETAADAGKDGAK